MHITPDSKYLSAGSDNKSVKSAESRQPLLFFNYQEYLVKSYDGYDDQENESERPALVINHFPNCYNDCNDDRDYNCVVRVPRAYQNVRYSDLIPQFSTYVPGTEPAALTEENQPLFQPQGRYKGREYGYTSATPLVPGILSEEEFKRIVNAVNERILEALDPESMIHMVEDVIDIVTFGFYSNVWSKFVYQGHCKRKLLELESFVEEEINGKWLQEKPVKVISLRRTGYLLLDFVMKMEE